MSRHGDQFEEVARLVCGKPARLSAEDCHATFGQRNLLCRKHERCRIHEKTEEQLDYVFFPGSRHAFLKACPGSGKTEVVGLKAAYEIRTWDRLPGGVAVLTFTNNAANIISERVSQFVGTDRIEYPHHIATIDSWLHRYLANPFGHIITQYEGDDGDRSIRLVESSSNSGFLYSFQAKWQGMRANECCYELESDKLMITRRVSDYPEDWQQPDIRETKDRFLREGFATYKDIEWICYRLLCDRADAAVKLARRFPLVIVDECQDLSESQLAILGRLLQAGSTLHFVGDLNQAIYAFRRVVPAKVKAFTDEHNFVTLPLAENFRSCQPIVDVCDKLVSAGPTRGRPHNGELPVCICQAYKKGEESALIGWFVRLLNDRGLDPERAAIVARGHSTVSALRPGVPGGDMSNALKAALAVHLWRSGRADSRKEALECIGSFISDKLFTCSHGGSQGCYCPQSVSPLKWRLVLACILDACLRDGLVSDLTQTWHDWLAGVSQRFPLIARTQCADVSECTKLRLSSPKDQKDKPVICSLGAAAGATTADVRITTIHSVKGETLDAILLVSSADKRGGKGGHWHEWLDPSRDDGEHTRFAFVASSRPKYLLAWAIPSPSAADVKKVEELGFTMT